MKSQITAPTVIVRSVATLGPVFRQSHFTLPTQPVGFQFNSAQSLIFSKRG